jgi:hypothetical protein
MNNSFDNVQSEELYFECEECGHISTDPENCPACGWDGNTGEIPDEFDGQPTEYEEWQDVYGGDDWDHGQFDDCDW